MTIKIDLCAGKDWKETWSSKNWTKAFQIAKRIKGKVIEFNPSFMDSNYLVAYSGLSEHEVKNILNNKFDSISNANKMIVAKDKKDLFVKLKKYETKW